MCSPRRAVGGSAPARGSGSGVVGELHQAMEKLARGLSRAEEGRKGELRGGSGDGGSHVGRRRRSGTGAARLGFVREGEWRGRVEMPLGEANGEGESLAGGGIVVEQLGACGVAVACSPSSSNGRVRAQRGGLGAPQRRRDGASCALIMEGHEWSAASKRPSCHSAPRLGQRRAALRGCRRAAVGIRRVRGSAEALMAGLGSQRGGRRRWRHDGAAAAA